MARRVLVTGGAGFIGSHVVDRLINEGCEVAVVDNLSTGFAHNLNPAARFYEVDIRSAEEVSRVFDEFRPTHVNHHAAQMDVRVSTKLPLFDAEVNVLGSLNLIINSVRAGVEKFIYISTGGAVYGEPEYLPVDEDHPINPLSQYGISKHTVEHYLHLYACNHGLKYTVLRYPNVYGPRQNPHGEAGVVAIFGRKLLEGGRPVIFGDGTSTRDYVYVGDVVEINMLVMTGGHNRVFNVGSGLETSVRQVYDTLARALGVTGAPEYAEARLGEIYRICLSATRAERELGWRPKVGLEEGFLHTLDFLRQELTREGRM